MVAADFAPSAAALGIPFDLYPFRGKVFDRGRGIRMHYLDVGPEGAEPVVMVHGNPTWSFYFRNLVTRLAEGDAKGRYRTIVPDHVGCGLSDMPSDDAYDYTLGERVHDLENLLDHVLATNHKPVTLVLHDWGGMIGMAYAARHPERIGRLVFLNTGAFPLPPSKAFPLALKLVRDTALGRALVTYGNAFSLGAAWVGCKRRPMAKRVRDAYVAPYRPRAHRRATLRFVQDIPLGPNDRAFSIVKEVEASLPRFRHHPVLLAWGERDFVFDHAFRERFEAEFPEARVLSLADAGHYVLEDAADDVLPAIERFLATPAFANPPKVTPSTPDRLEEAHP